MNTMKRTISILMSMFLLLTGMPAAFAERQNAIVELYSADGYYGDDVSNGIVYSYHVPQINADTPAAEEINVEIGEIFGTEVEDAFQKMEGGYSLICAHIGWEAYWSGDRLFLLITADLPNDSVTFGAYGYDFETRERVTNSMILEQKGITEQEYMENLREAVTALFEKDYTPIPEGVKTNLTDDSLLEDTLGWLSADQPIILNRYGEIETWVSIAKVAGAGKYDYLVTVPSSYHIHLTGDTYLVESCPETARAGETVTVLTCDVTDGDKVISVSGAEGEDIDWFEYQFVMPHHDVEVRVEFVGNGLT